MNGDEFLGFIEFVAVLSLLDRRRWGDVQVRTLLRDRPYKPISHPYHLSANQSAIKLEASALVELRFFYVVSYS